jgi:hypothetical protein
MDLYKITHCNNPDQYEIVDKIKEEKSNVQIPYVAVRVLASNLVSDDKQLFYHPETWKRKAAPVLRKDLALFIGARKKYPEFERILKNGSLDPAD